MGTHRVRVDGHVESSFQELRITLEGGGPSGMELVFQSRETGVEVKIWHPFNHEWVTLKQDALEYHGNTTR
jgi:hypothetical protein